MTRELSSFTYTSEPHSAPRLLSKTLPNMGAPLTLMSDPRVVRGNTNALARKVSKARKEDPNPHAETLRLRLENPDQHVSSSSMPYYNFVTKPFADNDVDVMKYLVESEEYVVQKREVETQADDFNPALAPTTFIPRKTGIDQYTQVDDVSEIFVFDLEVAPMLDVIVKKTMEQALMEVEYEEELKSLQSEVARYETQMDNEAKWMHEQEEHIKKNQENIREQLHSVLAVKKSERDVKTRVAGLQMMQQLLPDMIENITKANIREGTWRLPDQVNLEKYIIPEMLKSVCRNVAALTVSNEVIDGLLREAEEKYDSIESKPAPVTPLALIVHIVKTEEGAGESPEGGAEEDSTPAPQKATLKEVIIEIPMKPSDSIKSLQKKLNDNIKHINDQANSGEEGANASNSISGEFKLRDKISSEVKELYSQSGLPPVDPAEDALLSNFPLDKNIVVYFHI